MNELRYVDYSGDEIEFEQLGNGCSIRDIGRNSVVTVHSLDDIVSLRNYLNELIRKMTVEGSL